MTETDCGGQPFAYHKFVKQGFRQSDGQLFHNAEAVKEMARSEKVRVASKSTSFGGIQLSQRGDRPGGFDLTTDEAAELHVSLKVIRQDCK